MADRALTQYVTDLGGYSSEYGSSDTMSYVVRNILHEPKSYPRYGDFTSSCVFRTYGQWWKIAPEYQMPLLNSSSQYFTTDDFVEVILNRNVYIRNVNIFETYNPGAIVRILALNQNIMNKFSRRWFVLWESKGGVPLKVEQKSSRIFRPPIKPPPFPSKVLRIELVHDELDYYTELDAVQIVGVTDVDVDQENVSSSPSHELMECFNRKLSLSTSSSSDNGLFDLLPGEILFAILGYLSVDELSVLAMVSYLFYESCYSSLLKVHQHLNLQPYWHRISESSLEGFTKKCKNLSSLNLSWCGVYNNFFESNLLLRLLEPGTLTRLDLACCPLSDRMFKEMLSLCLALKELNISSTKSYLSSGSLQMISTLPQLARLNLFLTSITTSCAIDITRNCTLLESINLGSCFAICSFDEVLTSIANHCHSIKHLDLWRARSLTSVGLKQLAMKARHLESLDIGWCTKVLADEGAVIELVSQCHSLKKLFLTAIRSITDRELQQLSCNCALLEQLDLLGSEGVSVDGVKTLLSRCRRMLFLDLSFCPGITRDDCASLQSLYPDCSMKQSVAN